MWIQKALMQHFCLFIFYTIKIINLSELCEILSYLEASLCVPR